MKHVHTSTEAKVEFGLYAANIEEASKAFRTATRIVKSLRMSLIGETPGCIAELGIDAEEHAQLWNFQDEEGLLRFVQHLEDLVARARKMTPRHVPFCTLEADSIVYKTSKRMAELAFFQREGEWRVVGEAVVPAGNMACAVYNRLKKKGFFVKMMEL